MAFTDAGGFIVTWESYGSYGSDDGWSVQGREYSSDGLPVGPQFQLNTYTLSSQSSSTVAVGSDGRLLTSWQSLGSFGSDVFLESIQARLIGPIFTDGFESGDTSAWSSSQ